jgi:hypothetical protein
MSEPTDAELAEFALLRAKIASLENERAALLLQEAQREARRGKSQAQTFTHASAAACLAAVIRCYHEEGRVGQMLSHYAYYLRKSGLIVLDPDKAKSWSNAKKYVSKLLTHARHLYNRTHGREGLPFRAIVDRGRSSWSPSTNDSLADYLRFKVGGYMSVDIWRGQPRGISVCVEKENHFNFVWGLVEEYGIPVYAAKGYSSTTVDKDIADALGRGVKQTLLYLGDHDPTGLDIQRKLQDELHGYGCRPQIERVALTLQQAQALPAVQRERVKGSDTRSAGYVKRYGDASWEIESLPVHELRDLLLQAIADNGYDFAALKQAQAVEEAANKEIENKLRGVFGDLNERILADGLPDLDVPLDVQRLYLAPEEEDEDDTSSEPDEDDDTDDDDDDES